MRQRVYSIFSLFRHNDAPIKVNNSNTAVTAARARQGALNR